MKLSGRVGVWLSVLVGLLLSVVGCGNWHHYLCPIRVSADGKTLVVADWAYRQDPWSPTLSIVESKTQVLVYDLNDLRREPVRIELESMGRGRAALSEDAGMLALSAPDNTVELWSLSDGRRTAILGRSEQEDVTRWVSLSLVFSPNGSVLAAGNRDGFLRLWEVESQDELVYRKECDKLNSVLFSSDGTRLVVGCKDEIRIYGLRNLELTDAFSAISTQHLTEPDEDVFRMAISPTGDLVASSDSEGAITLWELGDGIEVPLIDPTVEVYGDPVPDRPASVLAFSPDGTSVAVGRSGTVKVWDVRTRRPRLSFKAHSMEVGGITFSSDGETLITSSGSILGGDGTIRLWEVDNGKLVTVLHP